MLNRLLPASFDNTYKGHWLAVALLVVITGFKAIMALNSIFRARKIAISADGIPVDAYPEHAAMTVDTLFALLGNLHLIVVFLSLLALIRYRAMIPLLYLILVYEYITRRVINHHYEGSNLLPGMPEGTAAWIVSGLAVAMIVGLVLSLWPNAETEAAKSS